MLIFDRHSRLEHCWQHAMHQAIHQFHDESERCVTEVLRVTGQVDGRPHANLSEWNATAPNTDHSMVLPVQLPHAARSRFRRLSRIKVSEPPYLCFGFCPFVWLVSSAATQMNTYLFCFYFEWRTSIRTCPWLRPFDPGGKAADIPCHK